MTKIYWFNVIYLMCFPELHNSHSRAVVSIKSARFLSDTLYWCMPWVWMGSERSSLYLSCQQIVNLWQTRVFCETRIYAKFQTLQDEVWSISLCKRSRGLACSIVTFGPLNFSLSWLATELLSSSWGSDCLWWCHKPRQRHHVSGRAGTLTSQSTGGRNRRFRADPCSVSWSQVVWNVIHQQLPARLLRINSMRFNHVFAHSLA
jgi:hypothetical protein